MKNILKIVSNWIKKNNWIFIIIIFLLWIGSFFIMKFGFCKWETSGQVGDSFGVINSLFSGFALIGVIYAIFLQREDLSLQREELRMTREELKRSAVAQEKSEENLRKQAESLELSSSLNAGNILIEEYNKVIDNLEKSKKFYERRLDETYMDIDDRNELERKYNEISKELVKVKKNKKIILVGIEKVIINDFKKSIESIKLKKV